MAPAASTTDVCPSRPAHGALVVRLIHVTPAAERARHLKPIAPNATAHARPPGAAGRAINTARPRRASTAPAQRRGAHTQSCRTRTRNTCAKMLCRWNGKTTQSPAHTHKRARAQRNTHETRTRTTMEAATHTRAKRQATRHERTHTHTDARTHPCTHRRTDARTHTHARGHARRTHALK